MHFKIFDTLVDILYPRRCPVCSEIVIPRGALACEDCRSKLILIEEPKCKKCGKPMEVEEIEFCYDCERKNHHYSKGFALWLYNKELKKSLIEFKYHNRKEYGVFYVEELIKKYRDEIIEIAPDILVPVPIHRHKQNQRGYNQADILAKEIGKRLNIAVLSNLLKRDKYTLPQKQLNDKERLKNLEKAFSFCEDEELKWNKEIRRVLLVDDIYTTGSTIEACTNILLKNGIKEVYFVSIGIGKGF